MNIKKARKKPAYDILPDVIKADYIWDKEWVGMEDNQNDKKYIIEIKSGLYVSTNAFGNVYSFTKNIEEAIKTSYLDSARDIAERCYGTVKEYRMKHEILEVVE